MPSIAIIGAGLAGVTVASKLKDVAEVTVFEKSRSPGGRMSTRRAESFHFDHGAQYFTVKNAEFESALAAPIKKGVVQPWSGDHVKCVVSGDQAAPRVTRSPVVGKRYVAVPGMNALAKYFAEDLTVLCQTRVGNLQSGQHKWVLFDDDNQQLGEYDWVVSTAPTAQTLDLLPDTFAHLDRVRQCHLRPCIALMLGFNAPVSLGLNSAQVLGSDVAWIADNSTKPGRPAYTSIVIHADALWSEKHLSDDDDAVVSHLSRIASNLTGCDLSKPDHKGVHRWRYAQAVEQADQQLFVDKPQRLAVAGDWCWGGRVEWAYLNAVATAQAIIPLL